MILYDRCMSMMNMFRPAQNGEEILRKGPWMPEEDEILVEYVRQYGARDWSSIRSKGLLPRTGKSCRLRWVNKLKPDLKRSGCKFSPEEEKLVVEMQAKLGNKWAKIASYLPGRTDNDVKNFWSTRQKRLLRATQRPKTQPGNAGSTADQYDFSKGSCMNESSAIQMTSLAGSNRLLSSNFSPQFHIKDDSMEQSALLGEVRRLCHNPGAFGMGDVDDGLMVRLQDLVANDLLFLDSDFSRSGKSNTDESRQSSSLSPVTANSRSLRSVKRRQRSKREIRPGSEFNTEENSQDMALPQIPPLENTTCNFELYDQKNNNYLDFLLQPEVSAVQANQSFCSDELPNFLSSGQQWEKLPLIYSEEPTLPECNIKEEIDSCTPDSILGGFPCDVFDSLEPLSPTSSKWWDSRLT